ncbi:MAG: phosphoribosylformylglycinamidine cyclo-ligase [Bacteroidetes bacterium]|nr:phosphoribosylformylglycinamidine cyclo-ligase [Bacteroidota bacterium]
MTTYKDAGVDIEAGEAMVNSIKPLVRRTFTPGVMTDIGAFGAFFQVDWRAYRDPVLVSSVDGVGTKLKVAFAMDKHDTVGQDLVNHCVNDIAVCGAEPLFFLDYFSTGKLEQDAAFQVIKGFATACEQNKCALIGGETAEMPDIYESGEYDLAGTIVGVVDKESIIDGSTIEEGDVLIGFPSSGLHTNGYSLARHVLFRHHDVHDRPAVLGGESVGEALLKIHVSYLEVIKALRQSSDVRGLVHVTGGGIPGNSKRIMPEGLTIDVDYASWKRPALFALIQQLGSVPEDDMRSAFNLGIGLIAVIPAAEKESVLATMKDDGAITIGSVIKTS